MLVREFLFKNFVPFTWFDTETDGGREMFKSLGSGLAPPSKVLSTSCASGSPPR